MSKKEGSIVGKQNIGWITRGIDYVIDINKKKEGPEDRSLRHTALKV